MHKSSLLVALDLLRRVNGLVLSVLICGGALFLWQTWSAYSRTRTFKEEVRLNTGDILELNRTVTYSKHIQDGNPFRASLSMDPLMSYRFVWKGVEYEFNSSALVFALHISPNQVPVFVADASYFQLGEHLGYKCNWPFYVQFTPSATGGTWQDSGVADSWLYQLPANLLMYRERNIEMLRNVYTLKDKEGPNSSFLKLRPNLSAVDPLFAKTYGCIR